MAENLTSKQVALLDQMIAGKTCRQAAHWLGVNERTARRWAATPLFQAELRQRTADGLIDASRNLSAMMLPATNVVGQLAADREMPPGIRLAAARTILGEGRALNEITNILERLTALEAKQ